MSNRIIDVGEIILNFDPLKPDIRHFATATEFALTKPILPEPVPWPKKFTPTALPLPTTPDEAAPLPNADALVVTWTAAEARALASLFTPGFQLEQWYKYKHNFDSYIPKVTGKKAPFNDPKYPLYYRTLGLYFLCRIDGAKVLCFKAGLHFAYDGPLLPIADLWKQIINEVQPQIVITTGTGGGIGADINLGDVVIGSATRFDCTKQFKNKPFAQANYDTSSLPVNTFATVTPAMLKPNADRLLKENQKPLKFAYPGSSVVNTPKVVTTDFFAYDDTNNTNGLQQLGNVCEMGDAVLGMVMKDMKKGPKWTSIRNASDGQMDGSLPKSERDYLAGKIYKRYGIYTAAGSVIASWAVIRAATQQSKVSAANVPSRLGMKSIKTSTLTADKRPAVPSANDILLALVAGKSVDINELPRSQVPSETVEHLKTELQNANVAFESSDASFRQICFVDEMLTRRCLYLAQISNNDAEVFLGSYLFEDNVLITKHEFRSS